MQMAHLMNLTEEPQLTTMMKTSGSVSSRNISSGTPKLTYLPASLLEDILDHRALITAL